MKKCTLLLFVTFLIHGLYAQQSLMPKKLSNGKYGYVDQSSSPILKPVYDKAFAFEKEIAKVIVNGKWGIIDRNGEYLVKPKYDYLGWSNDPYYVLNSKHLALINNRIPTGTVFLNPIEGVYAYMNDGLWGLVNENGKSFKASWDSINSGAGGHFPVFKKDKGWTWLGVDDKSPEVYFSEVKTLNNGLIAAKNDTFPGFALYNPDSERAGRTYFDDIGSLNSQYMKIRSGLYWGVIDKSGEEIAPIEFEEVKYVHWNNSLQYMPASSWQRLNPSSGKNESLDFAVKYYLDEGLFVVQKENKPFLWNPSKDQLKELLPQDSVDFQSGYLHLYNSGEEDYTLCNLLLEPVIAEKIISYDFLKKDTFIITQSRGASRQSLTNLKNKKTILINFSGIIESKYHDEFLFVERLGAYGLFDTKKQGWILNPIFSKLSEMNDSSICGLYQDSVIAFDTNGKRKLSIPAEDYMVINDSLIGIKSNGAWTIQDSGFSSIVNLKFSKLSTSEGPMLRTKLRTGWGLFNLESRTWALRHQYDTIEPVENGFRIVKKDNSIGIANELGYFTYKMSEYYEGIEPFNQKWTLALHKGLAGLIDQNGTLKISTQYESFDSIQFNVIPFRFRGKWGLLDLKERITMQPLNDEIMILGKDRVIIKKNGLYGVRNFQDSELIKADFDKIEQDQFGGYLVQKNAKMGYYNSEPRQIRPASYDMIIPFEKDLLAVKKSGSWQLINSDGRILNKQRFEEVFFNPLNKELYFKEKKSWIIVSLD